MKKRNVSKKVVAIVVLLVALLCMPMVNMAHSGRTDASGGHRDNKNKSGLGSYHYHCGGYPAHLHDGGVCPYTSSAPATTSVQSTPTTTKTTSSTSTKTTTPAEVKASKIEIAVTALEILIGESKVLTATVSPSNAADKSVTWTSSNKEIVMVDSEGEILALGIGEAQVTAKTSNGKEAIVNVTVKPIKVTEIKVSESEINLKVDENATLTATIVPENATDKEVEWTSENEEIATVKDGVITAVAPGNVKVICSSKDGIKAEVNVLVEELETVEVSASTDDAGETTTTTDSDGLLGLATIGAMVGIPVYIHNKKKK